MTSAKTQWQKEKKRQDVEFQQIGFVRTRGLAGGSKGRVWGLIRCGMF